MIFYVRAYKEAMRDDYEFPCFILITNSWDDYGYKTTFELQYYKKRNERITIGDVKIMDLDLDEDLDDEGYTLLDSSFKYLEDNFASLGTSIEYYKNLRNLHTHYNVNVIEVLRCLNDVACVPGLLGNFEKSRPFQDSLLREREAKSALLLGSSIIKNLPPANIKFSFKTKLKDADSFHEVDFNFDSKLFNRRLFGIVGKNGTGKTKFLSNLANSLSYFNNNEKGSRKKLSLHKNILLEDHEVGVFDTKLGPPFGKIIALSFSMFDTFKRPKPSKKFSYIYCGLRNDKDEVDLSTLLVRHVNSLKQINKDERGQLWFEVISKFIDIEQSGYVIEDWFYRIKNIEEIEKRKILNLSSGHSMLVYLLTELIANVSTNSLILFDEPENHLHPNAISNLINTIQDLLVRYNSYAIICTHSPIVIQEIPSSNVWVFEREGNEAYTRPLDIESFGENLSRITEHIFETNEITEGYKQTFRDLASKKSFKEIMDLFENGLSLNAKIYLSSLYSNS